MKLAQPMWTPGPPKKPRCTLHTPGRTPASNSVPYLRNKVRHEMTRGLDDKSTGKAARAGERDTAPSSPDKKKAPNTACTRTTHALRRLGAGRERKKGGVKAQGETELRHFVGLNAATLRTAQPESKGKNQGD